MNWMRDNAGLSHEDLSTVFRYEPKATTVLKKVASSNYDTELWSLEDEDEWDDWLHNEVPSQHSMEHGLILVLAKRSGEPSVHSIRKSGTSKWLAQASMQISDLSRAQKRDTFAPLGKNSVPDEHQLLSSTRRKVRILPFSLRTYQLLAERLHVHSSIARVVSRVDIPTFMSEKVEMGGNAYVYNCRSSNAWDDDLALSMTYFPASNLTFAILYGCPFYIEEDMIRRLNSITSEANHPLLLPGIFAELERARHNRLVENLVNEIETRVFEISLNRKDAHRNEIDMDKHNAAKRSAWLNLTYLKNGLVSWDLQLEDMIAHWTKLKHNPKRMFSSQEVHDLGYHSATNDDISKSSDKRPLPALTTTISSKRTLQFQFENVGRKISSRLSLIREEYDHKIRDCQMRLDGMAMVAQWALGETNVEIALATSRDSRHMVSISLVTMVFLPGTFFASVFSMSFFDWSGKGKGSMISGYIWIYVLVTLTFTLLTLGTWYYFVILRRRPRIPKHEEKIVSLELA